MATVVPTAQACQALADVVCESGIFRIDSLEKVSLVTRSGVLAVALGGEQPPG